MGGASSLKVEVKATRFGVDVTEVLKRYDVPLTMRNGDNLSQRLDTLPAEARRELENYGAIDWNNIVGADNKPSANVHWDTHISFYWFQTFPAGRTIEVTHRYRPVPRQFFFTNDDLSSAERKRLTASIQRLRAMRVRASSSRHSRRSLAMS